MGGPASRFSRTSTDSISLFVTACHCSPTWNMCRVKVITKRLGPVSATPSVLPLHRGVRRHCHPQSVCQHIYVYSRCPTRLKPLCGKRRHAKCEVVREAKWWQEAGCPMSKRTRVELHQRFAVRTVAREVCSPGAWPHGA